MLRRGDTGDWIGTFAGHKGAVWSAKLDNEALLAATGAADFSAKVWDAITGQELMEFAQHKHIVKDVEFSADRQSLATTGLEGVLRIFDLNSGSLTSEIRHEAEKVTVNKALWGADGNTVLTGGAKGIVRVWDLRSGNKAGELTVDGLIMDMELKPTPEGDVLTVAAGNSVSFFDATALQPLSTVAMPINFREEGGASLHPSGSKFIAGGSDVTVRVFDRASGEELECHRGHHGPVRCLRYAPDGQTYATGSEDGTIRIWETSPEPADGEAS